jgi:hypothetical protein
MGQISAEAGVPPILDRSGGDSLRKAALLHRFASGFYPSGPETSFAAATGSGQSGFEAAEFEGASTGIDLTVIGFRR